jgi:hypothetical protein
VRVSGASSFADELFDVKGGAVLEHEVKCPPELIGDDGVGQAWPAPTALRAQRIESRRALPTEEALAGDSEVVPEGLDFPEEVLEVVVLDVLVKDDLALGIDDADVHAAGMKINSAVELGGALMESHDCIL